MGQKKLWITILLLFMATLHAQTVTQEYAEGRVYLSNGMTLEGRNLRMTMESVTLEIGGQDQAFLLSNVIQVMAKKGKAKKFAQNCSGACIGFNLGMWLAAGGVGTDPDTGEEYDIKPGQQIVSMAMWGAVAYGIGYIAGRVTDDWEVIYLNRG